MGSKKPKLTIFDKHPVQNRMVYFSKDFGQQITDGLIDTTALSSAKLVADPRKFRLLAPHTFFSGGSKAHFPIGLGNGLQITSTVRVILQVVAAEKKFIPEIIVLTSVTNSKYKLKFLQLYGTVHGVLSCPSFAMQFKRAIASYSNHT